jgi:hypothetical protein
MRLAWPRMKHQFSIHRDKEQVDGDLGRPPQKVIIGHHRYLPKVLAKSPVDLLVIKRGH